MKNIKLFAFTFMAIYSVANAMAFEQVANNGCTIQNIGKATVEIRLLSSKEETIRLNVGGFEKRDQNCVGEVIKGEVIICFIFDSHNPCTTKLESNNGKDNKFSYKDANEVSDSVENEHIFSRLLGIFTEKVELVPGSSRGDNYTVLPHGMPYGNIIYSGSLIVSKKTSLLLNNIGIDVEKGDSLKTIWLEEVCDNVTKVIQPENKESTYIFNKLNIDCEYIAKGKTETADFSAKLTFIDTAKNFMYVDYDEELGKIRKLKTSQVMKDYFTLGLLKTYMFNYEAELLALQLAEKSKILKDEK